MGLFSTIFTTKMIKMNTFCFFEDAIPPGTVKSRSLYEPHKYIRSLYNIICFPECEQTERDKTLVFWLVNKYVRSYILCNVIF